VIMEHPIPLNDPYSPNEWTPVETWLPTSTEPVEESVTTLGFPDVHNLKRPATIIRNKEFYFEDVVILVENELFRVPRRNLIQESDVLRDKFYIPDPKSTRGRTDDDAIVLEGVRLHHFKLLLKILYSSGDDSDKDFTFDNWISILDLDKELRFRQLKTRAMSKLGLLLPNNAAEKVELGRKYGIAEWELNGLKTLIQRGAPVGEREAKSDRIGISDVLKIAAIRERVMMSSHDGTASIADKRFESSIDFTEMLKTAFSLNIIE